MTDPTTIATAELLTRLDWKVIVTLACAVIGAGGGVLVAIIGLIGRKFMREIRPQLASIDNAVNHGRMERIEKQVTNLESMMLDVQRSMRDGAQVMNDHDDRIRPLDRQAHALERRVTALESLFPTP